MNKLLVIDPQNDFCDVEGAALPVPGAMRDVQRVADFVSHMGAALDSIVVTLDSHPAVAVERPGFWCTDAGAEVSPFTQIVAADVRAGRYQPRQRERQGAVLSYLDALEASGKYTLMVWPTHCVLGTWGHAMPQVFTDALAAWEVRTQKPVLKVLKGLNPMTEQYSAVRAEVPVAEDASTQTNAALLAAVTPTVGDTLYVAGEALSHCVRATMLDMLQSLSVEQRARIVLLQDCMSAVPGFEAQAEEFLMAASRQGVRLETAQAAAKDAKCQ